MLASPASPRYLAGSRAAAMAPLSWSDGIWWVALAVLVLNDHLLKYAGLLPGWLTGKLSDVAGLIVAPVLAARLARARTPGMRALAFAAVVIPFCAVKLSPVAADALVAAIGGLGIRWRLWCDATDLIALAVLPLAWHVSVACRVRPKTDSHCHRTRGALPVILGAVACLATSKAGPTGFHTSAFLVNMTLDPLDVRVFRARGPLDCTALATDPMNALTLAFDPEFCTRLVIGGIVPLDRNWWALETPPDGGAADVVDPPCDAVIVRAADLPDTLLTWQQPGAVDLEHKTGNRVASRARDGLDPHGIYLERAGDRILAAASPLITSQPVTIALPEVACDALPEFDAGRPRDDVADAGAGQ